MDLTNAKITSVGLSFSNLTKPKGSKEFGLARIEVEVPYADLDDAVELRRLENQIVTLTLTEQTPD